MKGFGYFLFCAVIGAFFGSTGFWIGVVVGIFAWIGAANGKAPDKSSKQQAPIPAFPIFDQNLRSAPLNSGPSEPSIDQLREYAISVSHIYAGILSRIPASDSSHVDLVTDLIKDDNWIKDKFATLEELALRLKQVQTESRDSPMLFQLSSNGLLERVQKLPKSMKSRLATQLESLSSAPSSSVPHECKALIEKFLRALRVDVPISSERIDAEAVIMGSGDKKAISLLQKMRRNPSRYRELLRDGASGNTVLKTAFGVFAGMLAADAVRAAITDYQKNNLLNQLDQEIAKVGGIENVELKDKELEVHEASDFSDDSVSSFNDGEAQSWENDSERGLSDDELDDSTGSDTDHVSVPDDSCEVEVETRSTDSGSDYSYRSDD